MYRRILLALCVLTPQLLLAQPRAPEFVARLADAGGVERLDLLTQITAAYVEFDPARAIIYGGEAIELLASSPAVDRELRLSNLLSEAQTRLGDYPRALELAARAEQLASEAGSEPALARALENLGHAHQGLGDPDRALASFRKSLELARESGDQPRIAGGLLAIGRIHLADGRIPAATETLRRGLAAATDAEAAGILRDVSFSLAEAYAAMGRYQEAYEFRGRYEELRGETDSRPTAERIADLESRLESAGKLSEAESSMRQVETRQLRQRISDLESRNRLLRSFALVAGALLALLLLLGLYGRYRATAGVSRGIADDVPQPEQSSGEMARPRPGPGSAGSAFLPAQSGSDFEDLIHDLQQSEQTMEGGDDKSEGEKDLASGFFSAH